MIDNIPAPAICAKHPLAHACVAFVVCMTAYEGASALVLGESLVPVAAASLVALGFYLVGRPSWGGRRVKITGMRAVTPGLATVAVAIAASCAFVALGGPETAGQIEGDTLLVPGIDGVALDGAWGWAVFVAYCLLIGVFEETFFRGVLYRDFRLAEDRPAFGMKRRAIVAQAAVFALLHVTGLPDASALGIGSQVVLLALRVVAAFLFGLLMARLTDLTGGVVAPIAVHALYDLVLFVPLFASGGFVRTNPLAGGVPDLISTTIQVIVLAVVVLACMHRDSCYHTPSVS